jgi:L-amino acid N-acyltransferase
VKILSCGRARAPEILAILNDAIATTTALYDYHPRTAEMMQAWMDSKERGQYPVIGVVSEQDRLLLVELIAAARRQSFHALVGGIDAQNEASIALHRRMGFELCGTIRHAGFKFGRWLDLQFFELLLNTPAHPVED